MFLKRSSSWSAGTLRGLRIEFDQVWNEVCFTRSSRTVFTEQAKYKPGDTFRHLLRSSFVDDFDPCSTPCFWSTTFLLDTALKICLIFSLVATSQFLMSSARIPLMSLALPGIMSCHIIPQVWCELDDNPLLVQRFFSMVAVSGRNPRTSLRHAASPQNGEPFMMSSSGLNSLLGNRACCLPV